MLRQAFECLGTVGSCVSHSGIGMHALAAPQVNDRANLLWWLGSAEDESRPRALYVTPADLQGPLWGLGPCLDPWLGPLAKTSDLTSLHDVSRRGEKAVGVKSSATQCSRFGDTGEQSRRRLASFATSRHRNRQIPLPCSNRPHHRQRACHCFSHGGSPCFAAQRRSAASRSKLAGQHTHPFFWLLAPAGLVRFGQHKFDRDTL